MGTLIKGSNKAVSGKLISCFTYKVTLNANATFFNGGSREREIPFRQREGVSGCGLPLDSDVVLNGL